MESIFYTWINRRFPQNYIIKNPFRGTVILAVFTFIFTIVYKPLQSHAAAPLSYGLTMAAYSILAALAAMLFIYLVRFIPYFSTLEEWTLVKEMLAIFIILAGMGIGIYFSAFLIEPPAPRWNLPTFWDSFKNAFLVGILPFSFFTIINLNKLPGRSSVLQSTSSLDGEGMKPFSEEKIRIGSTLKKEHLLFYPSEFLYAEADGNYVVFYLEGEKGIEKKIIRNSITGIEEQLAGHPGFVRTHRSFIVNVDRVTRKKGNAAGYRLQLEGTPGEVPVSRQNIAKFDRVFNSKS